MRFKPLILIVIVILSSSFYGWKRKKKPPSEKDVIIFVEEYLNEFHEHAQIKELLFVSVKHQKLYLLRHGNMVSEYPISTSKYGVGNKQLSQKTPTGIHWIKHKMGGRTPINGILKGGVYTGEKAIVEHDPIATNQDFVTTRAMWLEGMEYNKNHGGKVDSYNRKIYIHGTHEEGLIGQPASHGCIRMRNYDVTELFDLVEKGLYVLILNV